MTPELLETLRARATAVRDRAYAPYSKFHVGCAIVADDAQIYAGVNVENASYPMSVCAERNTIAAAIAGGMKHLQAVVVCTDASPPSSPCGGCRQVIAEFWSRASDLTIVAINTQGEERRWTIAELLPDSFSGSELP